MIEPANRILLVRFIYFKADIIWILYQQNTKNYFYDWVRVFSKLFFIISKGSGHYKKLSLYSTITEEWEMLFNIDKKSVSKSFYNIIDSTIFFILWKYHREFDCSIYASTIFLLFKNDKNGFKITRHCDELNSTAYFCIRANY